MTEELPPMTNLILKRNYRSRHKAKLESLGWTYVGSEKILYQNNYGISCPMWKNYWRKENLTLTTLKALQKEGLKGLRAK